MWCLGALRVRQGVHRYSSELRDEKTRGTLSSFVLAVLLKSATTAVKHEIDKPLLQIAGSVGHVGSISSPRGRLRPSLLYKYMEDLLLQSNTRHTLSCFEQVAQASTAVGFSIRAKMRLLAFDEGIPVLYICLGDRVFLVRALLRGLLPVLRARRRPRRQA